MDLKAKVFEIQNLVNSNKTKEASLKCEKLIKQKNLDKFIKGSFCGLANLDIATGVQGKILSYMSYGLPVICSKKVACNFDKNVISYNDSSDLITKINKLKSDKKLSNLI